MSRRDKKRAPGFTVAGILLSTFVFLLLAPFLIESLGIAVERIAWCADRRKALGRLIAVEHFLKAPAFYCGMGIPAEPDTYRRAFGNTGYMPYNWSGTISAGKVPLSVGQNTLPESALFIAYALPGSTRLKQDAAINNSNPSFVLQKATTASEVKSWLGSGTMETQSWITFPDSIPQKKPLRVRSVIDTKIRVDTTPGETVSIQQNNRIYLFRTMIVFAQNDILYSYDYRASGRQLRIFGVKDIRFHVDMEKQMLTAYVLVRGDREHAKTPEIVGRETWPEQYISHWEGKASQHQLFAKKIVWRLPHCTKSNLLEQSGVTEQF